MRPIVLVILAAVAALAVGPSANAGHCSSWTTSTTAGTTVVVGSAGYYMVFDTSFPPVFLYEESNTIGGLQRQDSGRDDTCHGQIGSDLRLIY